MNNWVFSYETKVLILETYGRLVYYYSRSKDGEGYAKEMEYIKDKIIAIANIDLDENFYDLPRIEKETFTSFQKQTDPYWLLKRKKYILLGTWMVSSDLPMEETNRMNVLKGIENAMDAIRDDVEMVTMGWMSFHEELEEIYRRTVSRIKRDEIAKKYNQPREEYPVEWVIL